jgi:nuclear pore complex protein Nup188
MVASPSMSVLPAARYLFFALEDAASQGVSPAELQKLLDDSADFLSKCLGSYLPPSAASRASVESGSVSYGGKTLTLNTSICSVTVLASQRLALDEVQTYALLRRCVEEDKSPLPTVCDDHLVERLTHFYFRERLGLLKCIHALLIRAVEADADDDEGDDNDGESHSGPSSNAPMTACLARILRDGLEENLTALLCSHMRGATPARPQPQPPPAVAGGELQSQAQLSRDWAGQALEETQVMLECAFLMYYDQRTKCSAARFAQLACAFEAGALRRAPTASADLVRYSAQVGSGGGGVHGEAVAVGHVRAFTDSLRALCVVILVEALDLEGIVEQIQSGNNGSASASASSAPGGGHAMLNEGALREVAGALAAWPSDAVHGPVLLAWATLLALAPAAAASDPSPTATILTLPMEADPGAAAARAASGDAGFGEAVQAECS